MDIEEYCQLKLYYLHRIAGARARHFIDLRDLCHEVCVNAIYDRARPTRTRPWHIVGHNTCLIHTPENTHINLYRMAHTTSRLLAIYDEAPGMNDCPSLLEIQHGRLILMETEREKEREAGGVFVVYECGHGRQTTSGTWLWRITGITHHQYPHTNRSIISLEKGVLPAW